jgi:hypothetical protein
MAADAGTANVTKFDIARVYRMKVKDAQSAIDSGKAKLAAWIKLVAAAENIPHSPTACTKCGKEDCKGSIACNDGASQIRQLQSSLPLDSVVEMTANKWRKLVTQERALLHTVLSTIRRNAHD